jgi:hypothetical protein
MQSRKHELIGLYLQELIVIFLKCWISLLHSIVEVFPEVVSAPKVVWWNARPWIASEFFSTCLKCIDFFNLLAGIDYLLLPCSLGLSLIWRAL